MIISGIDNWLFKWADNQPECEPESYKCSICKYKECDYWQDYHKEGKNVECK